MRQIIRNLIDSAPEIDNPIVRYLKTQVLANATRRYLECQIVLKGGYSMAGVLTYAPDSAGDALQLAAVGQTPDKKVMLAEHFFGYDDVATVVVGRPFPEDLIKPANGNGRSIILGH